MKVHAIDRNPADVTSACGRFLTPHDKYEPLRVFIDAIQRGDPNLCRRCARSRAVQDALSHRRERGGANQ